MLDVEQCNLESATRGSRGENTPNQQGHTIDRNENSEEPSDPGVFITQKGNKPVMIIFVGRNLSGMIN